MESKEKTCKTCGFCKRLTIERRVYGCVDFSFCSYYALSITPTFLTYIHRKGKGCVHWMETEEGES